MNTIHSEDGNKTKNATIYDSSKEFSMVDSLLGDTTSSHPSDYCNRKLHPCWDQRVPTKLGHALQQGLIQVQAVPRGCQAPEFHPLVVVEVDSSCAHPTNTWIC